MADTAIGFGRISLLNVPVMGYKFVDFGTQNMVAGMPKRVPEQELVERFEDTEHGKLRSNSSSKAGSGSSSAENIPRWRKIEIMRERAALREALGEDELDLDELETEVFGSDEENRKLYKHDDAPEDEDDEEAEFEDDGFEDDDFEEFDED